MARSLDIHALSEDDLMRLMDEILSRLPAQRLRELRDAAEAKRQEKLEEAKQAVLEEMRSKLGELGVEPSEVVVSFGGARRTRRDTGRELPVKYRGPQGETWSGRGFVPKWLRLLEETGHNRDMFLVKQEAE